MKNYAIAIAIVAVILMMRSPPKTVVVQPSSDHKLLDSLRLKIQKIEALITLVKSEQDQMKADQANRNVAHSEPLTELKLVEISQKPETETKTVELYTQPVAKKPLPLPSKAATQPAYYRQYSNCANGNCGRVGLFGRRR